MCFHVSLLALLMSRLVDELRRASRRDALTGLLNRGALDEALADEEHRARRLRASFAVMMIDVDHFKAVNDRYGHATGDRALQHVAAVMSAQVRDIDRLGRYGGEEFLMVLPATALMEAAAVAERLRQDVAASFLAGAPSPLRLTVSIGVTEWIGDDQVEEVLRRADAALYRAKATGRDRVELGRVSAACPVATAGVP